MFLVVYGDGGVLAEESTQRVNVPEKPNDTLQNFTDSCIKVCNLLNSVHHS